MKYSTGNFLNGTNNRLESLNAKLKSVISRYSSLEEFVDKFFLILRVLRAERDHKASLVVQKVPVTFHSLKDSSSIKYMNLLTPYAYKYVSRQLELREKVKLPEESTDNCFTINSTEGVLSVTSSTCQCMGWKSMLLPCRHILAAREKCSLELFEESLCDHRWSLPYYKRTQRIFRIEEECENDPCEVPVFAFHLLKRKFCHR